MYRRHRRNSVVAALLLMSAGLLAAPVVPNLFLFQNPTGQAATINVNGAIDTRNPFFQSLGTNGRTCGTCHDAADGFTLTPAHAQRLFASTGGADPLFAAVDGRNCPDGTPGDAGDHSLLLNHGLIRVFLPVPASAEFAISVVSDPYGCAIAPDPTTSQPTVSVYRRPLPTTNLRFLSAVMFDGRESPVSPDAVTGQGPLNDPQTFASYLRADLAHQVVDATLGHAQASSAPTAPQIAAIVNLEMGFFSAQSRDNSAGPLNAQKGNGGPHVLAGQTYFPGINDSLTPGAFNPKGFTIFSAWEDLPSSQHASPTPSRETIAAGETIFNSFPLTITNVRGLNDNASLGKPAQIPGTCTTCHDTPNVGNHSLPLPLDIGVSHVPSYEPDPTIADALAELSLPDLPVYLVSGCPNPFGGAASFYTTDPAKALVSGRCSDFNRGKGPILRGLAARAPYFHNGAAASLHELVNFYNERFEMRLTDEQKMQLMAFLNSM